MIKSKHLRGKSNNFFYLKETGLRNFVNKAIFKLLFKSGIVRSETLFFKFNIEKKMAKSHIGAIEFLVMEKKDAEAFEKVKYYSFLNVKELIENPKINIFLAKENNQIIGYLILHMSGEHSISGLGKWILGRNEAWLGSAFVRRSCRSKGVNSGLISAAIEKSSQMGIKYIYTCINSKNTPSIRSFQKRGFELFGKVVTGKGQIEIQDLAEEGTMGNFIR